MGATPAIARHGHRPRADAAEDGPRGVGAPRARRGTTWGNHAATLSLASSLAGLAVFALVNGRIIPAPFALPGLGVAILAALAGVVFGHLGFAARRRAGSGGALPFGGLLLSYLLLAVATLYTALLILAIRNFS